MPSNPIRILHLIKSLGRGGAEKLIQETAKRHDKEGFEFFCLYFLHRPFDLAEELEEAGVRVHLIEASDLALPSLLGPVGKLVQRLGIDIIHCHLPWAGVLGRLVGWRRGLPVIYTEHNVWQRYNFLSRKLNKLTFGMQDLVIPVSEEVKRSILLGHGKDRRKPVLQTITNAVDTDHFTKNRALGGSIRQQLGIPERALVIGQVAVFRTQKRLQAWLAVAQRIADSHPEVHFILVGAGSEMPMVRTLIQELGLATKVHLPGTQTEVLPYLSAMDLYLMTSEFEGLPVAMLEAMACSLPVLSTGVGGIAEVVREGQEGFLSASSEYLDLAMAADRLLKEEALRIAMGDRARKRIVEGFGMERMVRQLEDCYRSVLKARK